MLSRAWPSKTTKILRFRLERPNQALNSGGINQKAFDSGWVCQALLALRKQKNQTKTLQPVKILGIWDKNVLTQRSEYTLALEGALLVQPCGFPCLSKRNSCVIFCCGDGRPNPGRAYLDIYFLRDRGKKRFSDCSFNTFYYISVCITLGGKKPYHKK